MAQISAHILPLTPLLQPPKFPFSLGLSLLGRGGGGRSLGRAGLACFL